MSPASMHLGFGVNIANPIRAHYAKGVKVSVQLLPWTSASILTLL